MSNYKHTLHLPKTDFPMKANLAVREKDILKKWIDLDLYQALREQGKNRPRFILHDGPPYANAHIHMGTAVNKVLKDIVVKSKTLSGFDAPYVPGWDCHGLPIELNVEKKVGKPGAKISASAFRQACRDYAISQVDIQREEFKRLGVIGDWGQPYLTMDFTFEANVVRSLAKIIQNGHLQKGAKPVHWCLDCGSALAEAEVEYADKTSMAIDVLFQVVNTKDFLSRFSVAPKIEGDVYIPIWTTTPWTLPANQAVALNPQHIYGLVHYQKKYFLIAESLIESAMQRYGFSEYKMIATVPGQLFENIALQHPFLDKTVPVILGEHVTLETGTGAVHTAPAHGQEDYIVGQRYQLPMENPVGDDGCFISTTPILAGQHVTRVEETILQLLKSKGTLQHSAKMMHSYPHCWRHKTPLIFRATPQWFVALDQNGLRDTALTAIEKVRWIPEWGQRRIASMIEGRPDWCISRQRAWGVPIALFLHRETGEMHPDSIALIEKVAERVEKRGVEAWFDLEASELLGEEASFYRQCTDILDVWFDSGVTHQCVLQKRDALGFPADLYLEGSDQHRGWFQSSLLTSVAMNAVAPYKTVLTHGYVVDNQGRKMSKSLGNVIAPETIIQSFGADVLRLWVASLDYTSEMSISNEILTRTSEVYRRLRNTARFLLSNLAEFDPEKDSVPLDKMIALDRWAIHQARLTQEEIIKAFDAYQFHLIYQKIHQFCSMDMGSFYLDIIKDRQYTTQTNSIARRSAQTALFHILEALARWMAPILSFTAEEIWGYIPGKRNASVFLNTWYEGWNAFDYVSLISVSEWDKVRLVRDVVNKELEAQRQAGQIGSPLEAAVHLYCEPELKILLDRFENELRFVLITSVAEVHAFSSAPLEVVATELSGLSVKVVPVHSPKCERCWHRREDVGAETHHPTVCARCVENIEGTGEIRRYA